MWLLLIPKGLDGVFWGPRGPLGKGPGRTGKAGVLLLRASAAHLFPYWPQGGPSQGALRVREPIYAPRASSVPSCTQEGRSP